MVFNQNAEEPLHGAADGAVDHYRHMMLAIGPDVKRTKPFRQVEINLRRAALPVTPDGIPEHVFKLGAVEGTLAFV